MHPQTTPDKRRTELPIPPVPLSRRTVRTYVRRARVGNPLLLETDPFRQQEPQSVTDAPKFADMTRQ
jgi:hypothetical protein